MNFMASEGKFEWIKGKWNSFVTKYIIISSFDVTIILHRNDDVHTSTWNDGIWYVFPSSIPVNIWLYGGYSFTSSLLEFLFYFSLSLSISLLHSIVIVICQTCPFSYYLIHIQSMCFAYIYCSEKKAKENCLREIFVCLMALWI